MNDTERSQLFDLGTKLSHRQVDVRIRAALDLGEHPKGYTQLEALMNALDDRDPAVREVLYDALDRIIAAHPEALADLLRRASDEELPPIVALARYLVHVGTPEAIEVALPTIAEDSTGKQRADLLDMLVAAKSLTNERLTALLDGGYGEGDRLRRTVAEVLGRRGITEGYQALFGKYGSRLLYDEFIARGPEGIRILCRAFPQWDDSNGEIAERLAAQRKKTEATIHELVGDPADRGIRTALEVLGYWDEPRNVELLMQIAREPSRDSYVFQETIDSLCRLEAPEAMDLLIRTLRDHEHVDWLRWDCAKALGEIGKPAALQALESIAENDPDKMLRDYAKEAIEIIRNPSA